MTTALLLVDVQRNMLEPPAPVPSAASTAARIAQLLEDARAAGASIVHIRNAGGEDDPDAPGTSGWELVHDVRAGEHVVDKHHPDAFAGTDLGERVEPGAALVVAGMQSEYCVRATALTALARGHAVTLVHGAHATYDGDAPAAATQARVEDELRAAGARIADPGDLLFALPR